MQAVHVMFYSDGSLLLSFGGSNTKGESKEELLSEEGVDRVVAVEVPDQVVELLDESFNALDRLDASDPSKFIFPEEELLRLMFKPEESGHLKNTDILMTVVPGIVAKACLQQA